MVKSDYLGLNTGAPGTRSGLDRGSLMFGPDQNLGPYHIRCQDLKNP